MPLWDRVLLVIAHPDDEAMFFGPILQRLAAHGTDLRILCLSTGASFKIHTPPLDCVIPLAEASNEMVYSSFIRRGTCSPCAGNAAGLGRIRKNELLRSCETLGVRHTYKFGA
jgi:LmbE family N-acetylglucosaminyl deacetylase